MLLELLHYPIDLIDSQLTRRSVILISPQNEVLLLHRVKTSTSFASAHVFPGGNLSPQDGECPPLGDLARHDEAPWYRRAALRELFEESGILLAKDETSGKMITVPEEERERGRRAIHQQEVTFAQWLEGQNAAAVPDIGLFTAIFSYFVMFQLTRVTREIDPLHALDHPYKRPETIHHANVPLLPPPPH